MCMSLEKCLLGSFPHFFFLITQSIWASLVVKTVKNLPAIQQAQLIPGLGTSPEVENGYPL